MNGRRYGWCLMAALVILATSVLGCATTEKLKRDFFMKDSGLKRKLAVLAVTDPLHPKDNILNIMADEMIKRELQQNNRLILVTGKTVDQIQEAEYGGGAKAVMNEARVQGVDAVMMANIADFEIQKDLTGIIGFRSETPILTITLKIRVTATEDGTLLVDTFRSGQVKLADYPDKTPNKLSAYPKNKFIDCLNQAITGLMQDLAEAVANRPWVGFPSKIDGQRVNLQVGQDVGLATGQELTVIQRGPEAKSVDGRIYNMTGKAIGTVKLAEVGSNSSQAQVVKGGPVTMDCFFKTRD
ncbi:MAG: hypothetical protein HQK56_12075 [Deltaproteobacteria bacterium]|nr:hypothetical protein [Deltaproteobacteria bacterium]